MGCSAAPIPPYAAALGLKVPLGVRYLPGKLNQKTCWLRVPLKGVHLELTRLDLDVGARVDRRAYRTCGCGETETPYILTFDLYDLPYV